MQGIVLNVSSAMAFKNKNCFPRVTGEVKQNTTNTVVCRVQGEWNSVLEFTYSNGETKYVDLTKLSVTRKRVRPLEKQGPFESR